MTRKNDNVSKLDANMRINGKNKKYRGKKKGNGKVGPRITNSPDSSGVIYALAEAFHLNIAVHTWYTLRVQNIIYHLVRPG